MIDLRLGNVLDVLAQMPSESVHCIVTSPPYWGLRAYGTEPQVWRNGSEPCDAHQWGELIPARGTSRWAHFEKDDGRTVKSDYTDTTTTNHGDTCTRCGAWRGELGLEPTPELFVEHIVAVMREARRVLRDDGTLWLNIGDSYANTKVGNTNEAPDKKPRPYFESGTHKMDFKKQLPPGLKPKDLVGIPWRVAFALQADGWYLRSDIIWHKPNPMPESVRDRPTKAHEYLFLLAKQPRYFYDADAVREEATYGENRATFLGGTDRLSKANICGGGYAPPDKGMERPSATTRNRRSVWTVTTQPFKGSHFATFPVKLIEPCILAATSERGVCSKCGAPWVRETKVVKSYKEQPSYRDGDTQTFRAGSGGNHAGHSGNFATTDRAFIGWHPSCACDAGEPVPATVLDPFNGAGTTGLVALQHGRNYIGIDLKEEYLQMSRERLDKAQLLMVAA